VVPGVIEGGECPERALESTRHEEPEECYGDGGECRAVGGVGWDRGWWGPLPV